MSNLFALAKIFKLLTPMTLRKSTKFCLPISSTLRAPSFYYQWPTAITAAWNIIIASKVCEPIHAGKGYIKAHSGPANQPGSSSRNQAGSSPCPRGSGATGTLRPYCPGRQHAVNWKIYERILDPTSKFYTIQVFKSFSL